MNPYKDEVDLLNALRSGDESAFAQLVNQYHTSLVRLARIFVRDELMAEELTQETWLAVLQGLNRFEARSTLKTWIFTILTNKAKTRGQRENRSIVFSDLDEEADSPTVDPGRFRPPDAEKSPNHWTTEAKPQPWVGVPEDSLLTQETINIIRQTIDTLPENQKTVITLRDVHELSSEETCNILNISETNQRVLLHRARARVRQALEEYFQTEN